MKVKLLDLTAQFKEIEDEVRIALDEVFSTQQFILSGKVKELERAIAEYCGVDHAVAVASGTDAILLSLMALDIGEGDEVITTPFTFFSTASSIVRVGATPVFVDIEPSTFNIDPEKVCHAISPRTKAIVAVHLFGQATDMEPIMKIASERRISVIEDACQSIGARYRGRRVGSIGDAGCFSFFPTKNLGCFGDGGMVVTNNEELAERIRSLRVHGSKKRYYHDEIGINSRLDEIQAAVLVVKLAYLEKWNSKRRANAGFYDEALADMDEVKTPYVPDYNESVYNQYVVRVERRNELKEFLASQGVGTEIYYPIPLHLQRCFGFLNHREGDFPEAERAASEVLALPIYPELTEEELGFVAEKIRSFYSM